MSEFEFSCPQCGQTITVDERYRGMGAHCPFCETDIVIPNDDVDSPQEEVDGIPTEDFVTAISQMRGDPDWERVYVNASQSARMFLGLRAYCIVFGKNEYDTSCASYLANIEQDIGISDLDYLITNETDMLTREYLTCVRRKKLARLPSKVEEGDPIGDMDSNSSVRPLGKDMSKSHSYWYKLWSWYLASPLLVKVGVVLFVFSVMVVIGNNIGDSKVEYDNKREQLREPEKDLNDFTTLFDKLEYCRKRFGTNSIEFLEVEIERLKKAIVPAFKAQEKVSLEFDRRLSSAGYGVANVSYEDGHLTSLFIVKYDSGLQGFMRRGLSDGTFTYPRWLNSEDAKVIWNHYDHFNSQEFYRKYTELKKQLATLETQLKEQREKKQQEQERIRMEKIRQTPEWREREKRASIEEYNANVYEIRKLKNSINFILDGNKWKGFGAREIASYIGEKQVKHEDGTECFQIYRIDATIGLNDIYVALNDSRKVRREKEARLKLFHQLHAEFEQNVLREFTARQIKKLGLDFEIEKRLFTHAFLTKFVNSRTLSSEATRLKSAYEKQDYLGFLDVASDILGLGDEVVDFPSCKVIDEILSGVTNHDYIVHINVHDIPSTNLMVVCVTDDESSLLHTVPLLSQGETELGFGISLTKTNKFYVVEKGARDTLIRKLTEVKRKGENVRNALEKLLSQNISYDEVRLQAERDAKNAKQRAKELEGYRRNAAYWAAREKRENQVRREREEQEAEARRERAMYQRELAERKAEAQRERRRRFRQTGNLNY